MKTKSFILLIMFFTFVFTTSSHAARIFSEEYEVGPVTVPASGMPEIPSKWFAIPENAWIIQAHWDILNAPTYLIHHAWALTLEGNNYLCGIPGSAIFATGREQQRILLPAGHPLSQQVFGKKVRKGQMFEIGRAVMLHNPDPFEYKDVKLRLNVLYYVPEAGDKEPVTMDALMLNIGPAPHTNANFWCSNLLGGNTSEYTIPAKTTQTDKWKEDLEIAKPLVIRSVGVHAHDFVEYVRLLVNGKEAWRANLVKDHDGHLIEIPFGYDPQMTLQPGDKINIEAQYKNPLDKPVDAMAFIFLIFESNGKGSPIKAPAISKTPLPKDDTMSTEHHHHH